MVYDFNLEMGRLFGIPVYWYGAVYTFGFLGVLAWFALRRRGLGWSMADLIEFASLMALGILIFGRAFDILVYELDFYRTQPWQALNWWRGGMASHGVMLGGLLGVLVFCRWRAKPFVVTADELTVPAAFVMGIGRIGNFIEGGVIGSVTAMPWGVIYPDLEGPRHPVALYDGAKNLLLIPILILILRRFPAGRGMATGAFVFLYAALRFVVDLFRDYEGGWLGIGQGQYFNLGMAAIGAGLLLWAWWRKPIPAAPTVCSGRRASVLLVAAFTLLCLYPLGIPTSWTRVNIEEKRSPVGDTAGPALGSAGALLPFQGQYVGGQIVYIFWRDKDLGKLGHWRHRRVQERKENTRADLVLRTIHGNRSKTRRVCLERSTRGNVVAASAVLLRQPFA